MDLIPTRKCTWASPRAPNGGQRPSSQNSSKPPSLDDREPKQIKVTSGRKRGGQPGHPKHDRPLVASEQVDKFHDISAQVLCAMRWPAEHKAETNVAERTVRHGVLYRKICLGAQSEAGSRFVERILTVKASLRRQKRDMRQFLADACAAALNGTPMPSLIPSEQASPTVALAA